jgi:dCMP deaminase
VTLDARPTWDSYFLTIAQHVAARADCRRAQHGAVLVKRKRIVATGYNGGPAGGPSCLAGECPRGLLTRDQLAGHEGGNHDYSNCVAVHAEANALLYADRAGTEGGTIYITGPPCHGCRTLLAGAGVERIVWGEPGDAHEAVLRVGGYVERG